MAVTQADILRALELVKLPASGQSLSASGRVANVLIDGGKVIFAIGIDPTEANAMEPVRKAAESAVGGLPGVTQVLVGLTADKAPSRGAPSPAAQARQQAHAGHSHGPGGAPPKPAGIPGVKQIIAVASGKGGVGKSTTTANLAVALATLGLKVGVLDADIYGPSVPKIFGITGKPKLIQGRTLAPMEAYGLKIMSIGFLIDEETPMIWRGPMVISAITQMLREVAWGELDVLVVDMPPGTGDAQLTMAQQTPLAGAVIVSTPQDLALLDARRGVAMFKKVEVPILGIVENMSYFICPECGHRSDIFAHGGARHEADRLGVPFLGEVPLAMPIRETSDSGRPIVASDPESSHAKAYLMIARQVQASLSGSKLRAAPRIVIE
ncbi:iron-sulfur cluster carrier protein ApbC [Bosea caraganae]|uniref:Iron-sulfur cluster carrier protein n=1 Tax=Bosea caraganae TaxID=2763117 RepID=A0A370L4S2_9HYPH|nr:Mrp/NBP35 family ATP-binding protein [Bosea caraganae]RDJ22361.1 iron-sulfur cluster carrier protein ApbC [Bosea caraganae]RDJ23705.1 iron-sulfur cluster carrier protein ApbC [Bosea caraganae]